MFKATPAAEPAHDVMAPADDLIPIKHRALDLPEPVGGWTAYITGRGIPIVVIHGFTAEGFLYAQTLNRLVRRGFKVVAIDMASHGSTQGLPLAGGSIKDYAELLHRALDELGIEKAIFAGHSMGGRCVAEFGVLHPDRTIALLLLDAIVGDTWDKMTLGFRVAPWMLPPFGLALVADSLSTVPMLSMMGRPDFGLMGGGYIGYVFGGLFGALSQLALVGAGAFLAAGLVVSYLERRDRAVAASGTTPGAPPQPPQG